jgi:hypothetical protein
VEADPIGLAGGVGLFSYALNNPLGLTDLSGLGTGDWWDIPANLARARVIAMEELRKRPHSHNDLGDARRLDACGAFRAAAALSKKQEPRHLQGSGASSLAPTQKKETPQTVKPAGL